MKTISDAKYPNAIDPTQVGKYPALVKSGGGRFYDQVLEYRVWVRPTGENLYYQAFTTHREALKFSKSTPNAEKPLVLVFQEEYIDEPIPGNYVHTKSPRLSEWRPEWLEGSEGTKKNIPLFIRAKLN